MPCYQISQQILHLFRFAVYKQDETTPSSYTEGNLEYRHQDFAMGCLESRRLKTLHLGFMTTLVQSIMESHQT